MQQEYLRSTLPTLISVEIWAYTGTRMLRTSTLKSFCLSPPLTTGDPGLIRIPGQRVVCFVEPPVRRRLFCLSGLTHLLETSMQVFEKTGHYLYEVARAMSGINLGDQNASQTN